ncbi:xanthine dehydrogenase YagT iron-sulfur-binding subunit [Nonomuraea thailandensis]|uniref:Xanthine dehydrogenase YagT iron-sulfur-binding subunit n=1 Tax=Nonomuraea thailandensis TaxID=1188745 RepID=A0A9X2K529_9ACTN|nr:2Fe-2S iron-sulfur cluster-binding protein [Nonomuraea thailandensis]MCP2360069.1 xanthine dehydrogenase YagT iron-sulfur-binding subunit [Nonomuraea thailandensis]
MFHHGSRFTFRPDTPPRQRAEAPEGPRDKGRAIPPVRSFFAGRDHDGDVRFTAWRRHGCAPGGHTRRTVLKAIAVTAAGTAVAGTGLTAAPAAAQTYAVAPGASVEVALTVNGRLRKVVLEPRVTLLDALRERLGLTGTKKGCDRGECGACTVLADGERVKSCLTLAVMRQGAEITTVEGLARGEELHPVQEAFIRHDAFQCGACTPGQIMSAVACIDEGHAGSEAEIREWMSGNLCRCAAYQNIVAAVADAAKGVRR